MKLLNKVLATLLNLFVSTPVDKTTRTASQVPFLLVLCCPFYLAAGGMFWAISYSNDNDTSIIPGDKNINFSSEANDAFSVFCTDRRLMIQSSCNKNKFKDTHTEVDKSGGSSILRVDASAFLFSED